MGLLGQIIGGVVAGRLGGRGGSRGRGGSMVMNGVLVALAAKAVQHYMSQRREERSFDPGRSVDGALPGAKSGPGGLTGGLGGLLSGLGGAGALGALLNQLRSTGLGDQVDSWVRPGPNHLIAPEQLGESLGDETVEALTQETGMPREALLAELSQTLPAAVDELTPDGREPSDDDLERSVERS